MNKIIYSVLMTVIVILLGSLIFMKFSLDRITAIPPDKIQIMTGELTGAGKLILAEQKVYQEYIKSYKRGPVQSSVLFRWLTTFQYIIDTQSPEFKIIMDGDKIRIISPAIILNEPAIDITTYKAGIVIEGSLWINEHRLINDEMTEFKSRSFNAGNELMKNPQIIKMCSDQIKLAVLRIASNLHLRVKDVDVVFGAN